MANPIVKSIVWLVSFTGLGYILLLTCTPSETNKQYRQSLPGIEKNKSEVLKKREQYLQALQAATVEKPIYLRNRKESKTNNTDN